SDFHRVRLAAPMRRTAVQWLPQRPRLDAVRSEGAEQRTAVHPVLLLADQYCEQPERAERPPGFDHRLQTADFSQRRGVGAGNVPLALNVLVEPLELGHADRRLDIREA